MKDRRRSRLIRPAQAASRNDIAGSQTGLMFDGFSRCVAGARASPVCLMPAVVLLS